MFPSLSEKYAVDAIKFIYSKGTIKKTDLLEIITSSWTLDKLVPKLEKDGLIAVRVSEIGRKTYTISLTDRGKVAAEQLKRMDVIAARTDSYEMPEDFGKEFEGLSVPSDYRCLRGGQLDRIASILFSLMDSRILFSTFLFFFTADIIRSPNPPPEFLT